MLVRELAGLFVFGERELLHTAHLHKASDTHFRRMLDCIRHVPEFKREVDRTNRSFGMQEIELTTGQRITFSSRQGSKTGRSMTLDFIAYDEAMYLSEAQRSSIVPTMSARSMTGNPQTFYAGSAVDIENPDHDGVPFVQVRESGLRGADGVLWAEWSAADGDPERVPDEFLRDPQAWALANPGLGVRISHEWVLHELEVEMSRRGFAVERLGIGAWPDISEEAGRVIRSREWADTACRDGSKKIVGGKAFGIDVNPAETWGSIGVCGARDDELQHTALSDRHRGTGWIVERAAELSRQHRRAKFILDTGGPAAFLIDKLKEARVDVVEIDTSDYATACAEFVAAVEHQTLRYPYPQPELDGAVRDARKQTMGDRWKWSRRSSTSADITPLVAVTLAHWGAVRHGQAPRARAINLNALV